MKKLILLSAILFSFSGIFAQSVGISEDNNHQPASSAILDVESTTKGMLIPRMSTYQRENISNKAMGLLVFDIDTKSFWFYTDSWSELISDVEESDPVFEAHTASSIENVGSGKVITDEERAKLEGVAESANNYSHPTGNGNNHIPVGGETGQVLTNTGSGVAEWTNAASGIPAGTIVPFAGDTASIPSGWLLCDGKALNPSNFAALSLVLKTYWGDGTSDSDPLTTFNLPDLRGQFLRGTDLGTGVDPDASSRTGGNSGNDLVGSTQGMMYQSHNHSASSSSVSAGSHSHQGYIGGAGGARLYRRSGEAASNYNGLDTGDEGTSEVITVYTDSQGSHSHSISTSVSVNGGNETRPKNAYVNYIIKY
jgi:microcystin-dependent protein